MSTLYWHTRTRAAKLNGSEREYLTLLAAGPADSAWHFEASLHGLERAATLLEHVVDNEHDYVHDQLATALAAATGDWRVAQTGRPDIDTAPLSRLASQLRAKLAAEGYTLRIAGVDLHTRDIVLNTALRAGSDPIRLAAKIAGYSSLHCWVEGPDRAWLASIIEDALDQGLYRHRLFSEPAPGAQPIWTPQGWDDVLDLLTSADDEPVVLSYSIDGEFPNDTIADWSPDLPADWRPDWATGDGQQDWADLSDSDRDSYRRERLQELFAQLPDDERWDRAVAGLRSSRPWARLSPHTLAHTAFGPPFTVYDLFAPDRDERAARAGRVGVSSD